MKSPGACDAPGLLLASDEARRFPHTVGMSLLRQGTTLRGWAAAMTTDEPVTGAMSSYVELTKK